MEAINSTFTINNDLLIITPEEPFEDNSIYEIRITGLKSKAGDVIDKTFTLCTKLSPIYCSIKAVKTILGHYVDVSDDEILYAIRESSKLADYLYAYRANFKENYNKEMKIDPENVPFEVSEFVKYKTAYDLCLSFTIADSASSGISGTVGNVQFSEKEGTKDLSKILKNLLDLIKKWQDAVKGFGIEGRALMQSALIGGNYIDFGQNGYASNPPYHVQEFDLNRGV